MTAVSEEVVLAFLSDGCGVGGDGCGDVEGICCGDGWGYGCGVGGNGDVEGGGCGDGCDYGWGNGSGIKSFAGAAVHMIDGVPTIIAAIIGNAAKGYILRDDLTLEPCYVAKAGNRFAHGDTLEKAVADARDKLFDDMTEDERIAAFLEAHERGVKYPARDFYDWHHRLTGSCRMGRDEFVRSHGIDLENGMYTVEEFIALTRNSYGGRVIARLEEEK